METMVKVEHLYKEFGPETKVLKDINLTVNKNEVVAILGPSGTGKSTLLRCLNYLQPPRFSILYQKAEKRIELMSVRRCLLYLPHSRRPGRKREFFAKIQGIPVQP